MDSRKPFLLLEHFFTALSSKRRVVSGFGLGLVASLLVVSLLVSVGAPPTITSSLFSWFTSFSSGAGAPFNTHRLNTTETPSTDLNKTQIVTSSTNLATLGGLEKTQVGDLPETHFAGQLPSGLIEETQNGTSHLVSSGGLEKAHGGGGGLNHSTYSASPAASDAAKTHNSTVSSGGSEKAQDGGLSQNHSTGSMSSAAGDTSKTHNSTADLVSSGGSEKAQDRSLSKNHSAAKTQNSTANLVSSGGLEKASDGGLSKNHSTDSVSSAGDKVKARNSSADLVSSGGVEKAHDVDLPKNRTAGKNSSLQEGTQTAAVPPPAKTKDNGSDERSGGGNLIKDGGNKRNESGSAGVKEGDYKKCDIFDGRWVRDQRKPFYRAGSCPYIDTDFDCHKNGRPDDGFLKWRWQPNGCNIPRLNATDFLVRLRGKRLIFVGDSLNRNMWESLVCILRDTIKNKKRVYEASGKKDFKTRGYYAFRFEDYNCSVDYVRSPFLVRETYHTNANGSEEEKLRLDLLDETTAAYNEAEVVVFNTGHWWTHEKTSKGMDYYQEGNFVYPLLKVMEAYKKALNTWARWVDKNIDSSKTQVVFRGYSLTHFRGGQWNSGGQCHKETEPIFNSSFLAKYPPKMRALEEVLKGMKTPVVYLNISRLTDYRKDGHPSIYRKTYKTVKEHIAAEKSQDCSHWCLPGIPDAWNELLYASLLMGGQGPWSRR